MTETQLLRELHSWFCDTRNLPGLPEHLRRRVDFIGYAIDSHLERESRMFPTEVANTATAGAMRAWIELVVTRPQRLTDEELAAAEQILVAQIHAEEMARASIAPPLPDPELN